MFTRYSVFSFVIAVMLFCSQSFAVDIGNCDEQTKKLPEKHLVLQSKQKNCVTVKTVVAMQSNSIKTMLQDLGGETNTPIPLAGLDDQTLVDIANILVEIYGNKPDEKTRIVKNKVKESSADQLLKIILAANFLDIEVLLNIGVDEFAHRIFVSDLEKLKGFSENDYAMYKKLHFSKLPKDLAQLIISRNLRSIDRVHLNDTKDRRLDAIKELDLATAQIVAFIAKYNIASADKLRFELKQELNRHDMANYIFFGPLPEAAIWPAHCPLPGNPNYDMSVGPHPDTRYVDNKDGTVKDLCTNLIWEQSPSTSSFKWTDAKSHCVGLRKANFDDWRLPNRFELESIVDKTKKFPPINGSAFPNTPVARFWSSSPVVGETNNAWYVNFGFGNVYVDGVGSNYRARCVR